MVIEFLGKRERLTDESAYPLTERAVEAFNVLSAFAMTVMTISKNNCLIGPEQVGIALSV